jgi:hypothetical protein
MKLTFVPAKYFIKKIEANEQHGFFKRNQHNYIWKIISMYGIPILESGPLML